MVSVSRSQGLDCSFAPQKLCDLGQVTQPFCASASSARRIAVVPTHRTVEKMKAGSVHELHRIVPGLQYMLDKHELLSLRNSTILFFEKLSMILVETQVHGVFLITLEQKNRGQEKSNIKIYQIELKIPELCFQKGWEGSSRSRVSFLKRAKQEIFCRFAGHTVLVTLLGFATVP